MKFNCPKCKKQLALSSKMAGKTIKVRCTSCGSVFKMRLAPSGQPEEPVAAEAAAPAEQPAREQTAGAVASGGAPTAAPTGAGPAVPARPEKVASKAAEPASPELTSELPPEPPLPPPPESSPLAEASRHRYFAVLGGKRLGPMPFAAIRRLATEAKLKRDSLVWRKGMPEWVPAAYLKELADLFPPEEPAVPPPLPGEAETAPVAQTGAGGPKGDSVPKAEEAAGAAPEAKPEAVPKPKPAPKVPPKMPRIVTGAVMDLRQVSTDAEPTDQEIRGPKGAQKVHITSLEKGFFSSAHRDFTLAGDRKFEEIETAEAPFFPVEVEKQTVEKGAKATMRDFSVMVRLSRSNRRRYVILVTGIVAALATVTAGAISSVLILGHPLAIIYPAAMRTEPAPAPAQATAREVETNQAATVRKETVQVQAVEEGFTDPSQLDFELKDKGEPAFEVALDEDQGAIDREQLAARIKEAHGGPASAAGNGQPANGKGRPDGRWKPSGGSAKESDEMSLEEFAALAEGKKEESGSLIAKSGSQKGEVADRMDSAMGNLLGGPRKIEEKKVTAEVKERESDGTALKAIVARHVGKKVGGERKKFQRCVDSFAPAGLGGQIRATLHFLETGTVEAVTVKGGTPDLERCFKQIFDGWRIATVNRKVAVPISIKFE